MEVDETEEVHARLSLCSLKHAVKNRNEELLPLGREVQLPFFLSLSMITRQSVVVSLGCGLR